MFADTKIWTRLTNPMDAESLQKDLDSLSTWSAQWQLKFNPEKCKLMHIGHKQDIKYTIRQDNIDWQGRRKLSGKYGGRHTNPER